MKREFTRSEVTEKQIPTNKTIKNNPINHNPKNYYIRDGETGDNEIWKNGRLIGPENKEYISALETKQTKEARSKYWYGGCDKSRNVRKIADRYSHHVKRKELKESIAKEEYS